MTDAMKRRWWTLKFFAAQNPTKGVWSLTDAPDCVKLAMTKTEARWMATAIKRACDNTDSGRIVVIPLFGVLTEDPD